METLKATEKATIQDIAKIFNSMNEEQKRQLLAIGYEIATGEKYGRNKDIK